MSFITLVTERFEALCAFYGAGLGGVTRGGWERSGARGARFEVCGLLVEILDNSAEARPLELGDAMDRFHLVIRPESEEKWRAAAQLDAPEAERTSWGPRLIRLRDPDGTPVAVWFD